MNRGPEQPLIRFEPLRPVSPARLAIMVTVGPMLWLVALFSVALAVNAGWLSGVGLLVSVGCFSVSLFVLILLRRARVRQEGRYVDSG